MTGNSFEENEEELIPGSTPEDYVEAEADPVGVTEPTAAMDDFAVMPEPPAPPAFEIAPTPPKRPRLSSDPRDFEENIARLDEHVERTRQWEERENAKAAQKQFMESRRAHNAEARKVSAATGAQFNYDAEGIARPRVDPQTGEQAFTKRVSPVRWDEQGRPFQVIQNEQGTRSERIADPDANAAIGPNPTDPEDKFIYRKTKFQPWEAIDPEEGINSTDGRVVRASAKALFDREKTTLKRERDEISLSLRDPARPNRLSPEARQKVESEMQGLAQPAPPPSEVKGMFGGVNIEATEAAKKKWQEGETFRAGLLAEKQAMLAADDERAGLETRAYELDQNLFGLEKMPLSQFVQERRKKKAESLADLDPEAARAEIESRGAAIAEEDAATETAMQDLQRRSAALNERTKKGITIQEMESVAAERAAIEADAAAIEERVARRNASAGEVMQGVEAIKAKEDAKREESFAELDRQAAKYPELAEDAKAFRAVDSDYRSRMEALQQQPEGPGKEAAVEALNSEFETKRKETGSAYVAKLEKRISGDVGAAIEKVAGPGGALGFKSQIEALENDAEIDPEIKKIATEVIRDQAVDALIRSNNMKAVGPAVKSDKPFSEAFREAGAMDPKNPEHRARALQMLEQDPGLGAKLLDGFDRVMTTFGARMFGAVSAVGKAISHRMGLDPDNIISQAADAGYNYKLASEEFREKYRDPRLETDEAMNRWIMPAVSEALPNLAGMALTAVPVVGPALAVTFNVGQLYDEAYSQALRDEELTEDQRHNAATIYAALALPAELIGDVVSGGVFTARMIPKAAKQQSAEAAAKFWSKFTNVGEVWDKLPPVLKRGVAIVAAGGTEGLTETVQDKILNATIETIKTGNIGDSVSKALADNRGALDTFIIASISGGGIKTLETATRTLIERGQNPEEMARRYNGVANSFRLENVIAYAQQAGVSFDPKEYEALTQASEGLVMRLDRINPKDKIARNDVARELAQVEAKRLTMISEILGKNAVDQAMSGQQQPQTPAGTPPPPVLPENIAAMQAEIGQSAPERQAPLATAIKILSGAPMDSLTKAEQDAIKPHVASVGGQTVLTDDILSELSQTSPQAAALMQQGSIRDESTRRLEILATEKEGGETNENQIQQKGPENVGQGTQSSQDAGQNDQGSGTGALTPVDIANKPSPNLPPRATETVEPRPTKETGGKNWREKRNDWDEKYGSMRKGRRTHNDDGTPYQESILEETMGKILSSSNYKNDDWRGAALGDRSEITLANSITDLLNDGWVWDDQQQKMVNPANPNETPSQGVVRLAESYRAKKEGSGTGALTPGGAAGLPSLPPLPVGRGGQIIDKKEKAVANTLAARLVQGGADATAALKFSQYFIKRETLKGWGTEKLNAAVNEFVKAGGMQNPQAIIASVDASDAAQGAEFDKFTNEVLKKLDANPNAASMTPEAREKIKLVVRNQIAPSLARFRPIFQGISALFNKAGDSDVQVNRAEELIIDAGYMLADRGIGFWADTENADILVGEEVKHISQIKVMAEIRRTRTGEADAADLDLALREAEEIFLQLPEPVQKASRSIYGAENLTPGQSGMEFFRQMLQGDIALSEGRILDRNGKVITELAVNDRPWIERMKSMFERLFKVFTDLRGNLGQMMRDEGRSDAEIEEITARVEKIRKDSLKFFQNLKKEGDRIRGEAYGREYAQKTQALGTQSGTATGVGGGGGISSGTKPGDQRGGGVGQTPGGTAGRNAPAGTPLGSDQAARLAELEAKDQERQAREERAKERRAEYVNQRAGDLKDYEKVVESTPEDAREPVRQLLSQAPAGNTGYVLAVNQRRLPSTWVALPPGVVQTSHIGPNFQKNPEYAGQNTRAYDTDPAEQNKVRAGALPGALNEDILTSTDPSSANSAPQVAIVIDAGPDGQPRARWQAAGGNAREMMSNLAPQEDQDRLSQTWGEKGAQFGFENMPEGFRGYRFLGVFDIRTEAGARDYQKLVDDLNPSTGVVQDVSDRADLDAKNIPLDLVADLPVMMSGKQAVDALSRLLTAPGNIVERNRIEPMAKNPAQAQAYMQRMMFTAGLGQPKLTSKIADYQLQNRNAAFVELSADSAKAAIALRQSGNPGIADALGGLLSNVADYLDEGRSLKTSLELAASQIEMDALVGDTAPAVEVTKRLVELVAVDKRGRLNSEATSAAMKDYMVALASGISRANEDAAMGGDMFGAPMTMAERIAAINAAHRRQPQPDSETTLSAATSNTGRRMRALELKRRQEGLNRYESEELARLERAAGQQFMDFFEETRDQRFELEQEVERRGIERAPVEQMDLVLSAAPSFNRTKAAARLKESTRQRKKDTQSRIEELKKAGGEYPHRMDGNWRSDWKITSPGRKLRAPKSGAEFLVQSINIPEDKVTLVRASSPDQPGLTMGIKEAQKRFEVELNAEELEIEPYFISRLTDMAQMKKDFDRAIKNIAAGQKKALALIPALKGAPRGLEKIGEKLQRQRLDGKTVNLEKLVEDGGGDILRASVVVDTADQIQQTIADILHTFAPDSGNTASTEQQDKGTHIYTSGDGMVKIWMEDRFNVPLASGYSDINIKIQLLPGYWAELQVHIPEMLVVKEGFIPDLMPDEYRAENLGVPNGVGHKLYEEYRAPGTSEERKAYLEKQMAALYALAIRKYLSRTSANSSQATSRTKGAYGLGSRGLGSVNTPVSPTNSTRPSGVVTFGVPSSSQNFAPSGNISRFSVSSFIPSSPTREAAASQPVSELLQLSRRIATKAHKNQFRKDGKTAYIEHIRDVVDRLENADENIRAAAWLHDVVEDNPNYNFQEIKRLGVPEEVIAAVRLLTKSQNQSVASYYKNIRKSPIATAVKIADMMSNLADNPSESQRQRYQAGLKYLQIPGTGTEVFNQDTTLSAARSRRKVSDDQLAFDFTAPAVQDYREALEADGITHPVAQAAAAQQDIGLPATEALDLFTYQAEAAKPAPASTEPMKYGVPQSQWDEMANFNDAEQMQRYGTTRSLLMEQAILSNSETPAANPLTAPEPARIETQTDERTTTSPSRGNETPRQSAKTRGTQKPAQDGVLGDLFSFMAGVRATERDSADAGRAPREGTESGGGVSPVDGRQSDPAVQRPLEGDGRSGDVAGTLPVSGELGGQRGRAPERGDQRIRGRILQPGNGVAVERPPVGSPERNISLSREQALAPRGIVGKLRANLAAIRIIQTLDSENRLATAQEKEQLVKFSGWGALSQVFDDEKAAQVDRGEIERLRSDADRYRGYQGSNSYYDSLVKDSEEQAQSLENWKSKWYEAHKEVRTLLSDQEYRDARRSTINAHYTSPEIVGGMWDIIEWLGFKGGNILEPGAGIGHFFGLMPEKVADRSKLFGVELDAYTSKILKALYPEADIQNTGFQTADIADNSVDLAVSNVPFANIPVRDPALEAMGGPTGNLHDYFFGKALTKLKPGGIQVFITSAFTMDKGNPEIRKWLAERADLVAAYRLPNDAFRENAGTDVVTDILILRKKDGKPFPHAQSWVNLDNTKTRRGEDIRINEYFAAHPQNILGQLDNDGSMYGDEKEMTVHGDPALPPAVAMKQDLARLPQGILGEIEATGPVRTGATGVVKVGNIIEREGKFYRQGQEEPDTELNDPKAVKRVRRFLSVRDALNRQYDLELSETATEEEIEANRRSLNTAYDQFLSENGYLHDSKNKKLFIDDPDYFRLLGAEIEPKMNQGTAAMSAEQIAEYEKKSKKKTYTKADIFSRRVMVPRTEPTRADTLEDAYGVSLGWRGRVDTQFIGQLIGKTPEQVETQLLTQEIAVRDPDTGNIFSREQYLSGNVRKKLAIARSAGPDYARNVRLLEAVQPQRVGINDIRFEIGATWIPADIYNRFLQSLGVNSARFVYVPTRERSAWERDKNQVGRFSGKIGVEYKQFETTRIEIEEVMDSLLNLRSITLRFSEKDGGGIDMGATTAARERAKLLNQRFQTWARETPDVTAELEERFNNEVNAFVQRTYDGQFLQFPWANKDFDIYPDKKNTIWRALQEGYGLIAHGVGGGKTIIGSAIALEMRRLGMARKPMIVVHNATLEGFAKEIAQMAPTARVLVGRKDELTGDKRKEFLMRIAAGDWDAVVIAHSTFGMIEDDPQVEINASNALLDEFLATLREKGYKSIAEAKEDRKKSPSVKALIKLMERVEGMIKQASERRTDTGLLNFQQLGVDALIVDEVHKFKKMPFSTQLEAKGIDGATSKRAYNLFMRARQIQERMGGKNVFSMTGTPVTNTLGEIWNMVRLVAPNVLKEWNVELFDQFVSKFAQVTTEAEMGPTGEFKNVDRLARFVNLPEWNTFLRQAADVKLGDDLVVKNRPGIKGGRPELVAVSRTKGVTSWVAYIRRVLDDFSSLSGETLAENPSLTAVPVQAFMASRAAAIDIRLINPRAKDEPDSKVNRMVERLMGLYRQSTPYSGAQVIFADSFNSVRTTLFEGVTSAQLDLEIDPAKPAGTTFNLYEDIRQKLIAKGIPANEIAVITDSAWNSDKKKQALFDMVNEGKVRVILGSTERLGTGVNMQRRMVAAHHLDVPWTPAELEQRDGRVFRQGNILGELKQDIELIRYGMSDTLDAALWQKLETKQRFSNAALSGKVTGRELAEDKGTMTLEEQRAVLSGKYGRRLWEITSRLQELDISRNANRSEAETRAQEIRIAQRSLEATEAINARSKPSLTKMRALAENIATNGTIVSVDGQAFDTKAETAEAVKAAMEAARNTLTLSFDGKTTADPVTSLSVNGVPIHLHPVIRVDEQYNDEAKRMEQRTSVSFELLAFPTDAENDISFGTVTSPATLLSRLEELGETTAGIETSKENNLTRLRALANMGEAAAWPFQAEYDALTTERVEVEKLYNEDLKNNTADAVSNDTTLSAARRQTYDPNQLELDFDAAPRDQAAAQEDAEKSAAARFQSGLDGVMGLASSYSNIPGVDMDEVRQTARIALADAARTFDPTRGVPFGPYSSIVVRNRLNALYRRENLRRERIPQSLDEPLPGDFTETRQDYTPDTATPDAPTSASRNEARRLIDEMISTLPERMRAAVDGYLQQRQQDEIGEQFGISKQAVSKLQQEGFKRLRQKLTERGIDSVSELLSAARKNPLTDTLAESMGQYGIPGALPLDAQGGMGSLGSGPAAQPAQNPAPAAPVGARSGQLGIPAEQPFAGIAYAPAREWGLRTLAERFQALRNRVGGQPVQPPIFRRDFPAHEDAFREAARAAESFYRDTLARVDAAYADRRGKADSLLPRLPEVRELFTDAKGQVQLLGSRPVQLDPGEALFAAPGTPQDDGDFIAPGESFESDLENLLNDLNGVPADIDNAVAKQEQAALEEGSGQPYQVGRPDLAFGANNPDVRGMDQFYTDRFLPETEAQWETSARDMVAKDFEGTRRSIEKAGLAGQTISPELTKAADQIANSLRQKMLQTGKDEDRRAFNVFWYAYRATGTEAGRALASRRDPFKTPAMRHREFLLDLMLTPGKKDKARIDAEPDPAKKSALIDSVTAALLKKLKDAGITPEDILGNRVVVGLNNAEIQRQFRTGLTPKQAEVFDLLLRKNQTPAQIAQRTGMKPDAVEAVFTAFKNRMRQQHLAKFKAGIHKQSEVTLGAAPTQSGLFGGQVSDAEAEAAFDQWFSGMVGTTDTKKIGRPKFRIDDPAHVMRLARAIQSARGEAGLSDMAYEWWIMNILSGPQTQVVNVAGNTGFLALDTTLQRGVEALVNVFVRDKKAARLGEFRALARGILPGITKGLAMASKAWSAEHDFYEHTVLGTPLELGQWDKLGNTRAAIPGKAGRVIRIPGRALLFADSFFKQLTGQMNVAAFAYRIAKTEGLRGQALTDRVAQLSKTRGEIVSENLPSAAPSQEMVEYFARQLARRDESLDPAALVANRSSEAWELAREQAAYDAAKNAGWNEDAWIRAVEKSKEMTFQQDLQRRSDGGNLFEDAAAKLQDARFNNQLIGFFFPFVKTPYNIFRTGIRKSPLGTANLAFQAGKGFLAMKDGKAFLDGDPTLVRDLSEQLIAWTAMALIFGAVQGDEDDDEKMLLITGSQPRSESSAGMRDLNTRATGGEYVIRIGGRNGVTIPYGRLDPIATVLGTTVDLIRSIKRNGTPTENLASVWNYMVAQTNSKTFLQGIANIATILEGKSDPVGATQRTVLQALVPNIIRQPLRNLDDYVRDTKLAPAAYTLFPSGNLAEPRVDVYGNEVRKGSNPVMRLFLNSALATEPVLQSTDELLMNWNRENPSMAYAPQQAKAVYKGRDGKEVEMTADEARRYRLAAGRLASVKLRAVATPARVANPTEADIQAIRNAFSEARREVRERMFAGR